MKCIKDLNIRADTIKLLQENMGKKLFDIGLGNDFWDMMHRQQRQRQKWDYFKLKEFCKAKEIINKAKRQPKE